MAVLTYGGISLQILKTHHVASEDVYDDTGLDYLWTRYTFDVTGVVNLQATAYATQPGNPAPVATPGTLPFLTVANVRDTLSLPRQPLTYVDETGNVMVQSPASAPVQAANFVPGGGIVNNIVQPPVQLDCDCDGGPKPLRPVEVLSVHGAGQSVIVRFAVSTTLNDSIFWSGQGGLTVLGKAAPKPPVILSNRWSTSEELDEGAYSTRTLAGRAVFRADLLRDLTVTPNDGSPKRLAVPDDFRAYMMGNPVPPGFQRRQVFVEQEPSGFAVRWRLVDVQLPVTLTDQRAYKLEYLSTYGGSSQGVEAVTTRAALAAADAGIDVLGGLSLDPIKDAGKLLGGALHLLKTGLRTDLDLLPTSAERHVITAYGQPGSKRQDLAGLCYKAWFAGASPDANDLLYSGRTVTLTVDRMGKWARLTVDIDRGPVNTTVKLGFSGIPDYRSLVPADDGMPGVTSSTPGAQPTYPSDSNTRGTALEWLVAQTLMNPYTEAPQQAGHSLAGQGLQPP